MRQRNQEILWRIQVHQQWNSYLQINAVGPKYLKNGTVALGIYIPEIKVEKGLPILDHMSVFTAEMVALLRGLWWVEDWKQSQSVIRSDSAGCVLGFMLIPAHMGNKRVDNLAKKCNWQAIEFALQHGPPECTEGGLTKYWWRVWKWEHWNTASCPHPVQEVFWPEKEAVQRLGICSRNCLQYVHFTTSGWLE